MAMMLAIINCFPDGRDILSFFIAIFNKKAKLETKIRFNYELQIMINK